MEGKKCPSLLKMMMCEINTMKQNLKQNYIRYV